MRRPVSPKYTKPKPQAIVRKNATNITNNKKREPEIGMLPIITATSLPMDSVIFTMLDHDKNNTASLASNINAPRMSEETLWSISLDLKSFRVLGIVTSFFMNSRGKRMDVNHPISKRIAKIMAIS